MFNSSNDFFIKPLELQRDERIDFTMVPSNNQAFEEYVKNHLTKKDLRVPYLLNEFVKGEEFAANVACRDGAIFMIQVRKNLYSEKKSVTFLEPILIVYPYNFNLNISSLLV